jgi:light-regulated signal transduction histidine kinase (bacteriophytochrome)
VRNPLCSAITALSFVAATTKEPIQTPETRQRLQNDVSIIDASLQFINELLRNMLDMHKAADKQMKISKSPTDLLQDVFQPVAAILHLRGSNVKILVECPTDLIVNTDRMRLKQIALNLALNASKFVEQGYNRMRAEAVKNNNVQLYFEDSGSGIPVEKRGTLFAKFQDRYVLNLYTTRSDATFNDCPFQLYLPEFMQLTLSLIFRNQTFGGLTKLFACHTIEIQLGPTQSGYRHWLVPLQAPHRTFRWRAMAR